MKFQPRKLAPLALSIVATTFVAASLVGFGSARRFNPTDVHFDGCDSFSFDNGYVICGGATTPPAGVTVSVGSDDSVATTLDANSTTLSPTYEAHRGSATYRWYIPTTDPNGDIAKVYVLFQEDSQCVAAVATYDPASRGGSFADASPASAKLVRTSVGRGGPPPGTSSVMIHQVVYSGAVSGRYYVLMETPRLRAMTAVSGPATSPPYSTSPSATGFASASTTLTPVSSHVVSQNTPSQKVNRTGSSLRSDTYFRIVRSDNVTEPIHKFRRESDGTITFTGYDFPNTTLTIQLVQPGFLRQTQQRAVVSETLRSTANTSILSPIAIELVFGDADGDNDIDSTDTGIINGYVGKTSASDEWDDVIPSSAVLPGGIPIRVRDLDENQDGQITAADVNVALANVGRTL